MTPPETVPRPEELELFQLEPRIEPLPPPPWRRRKLLAGLMAFCALTGVYIVPPDQQAVVTRFGQIVEPRVTPGIHLTLPWPVDRVHKLKVQQLQRLVIGGEISDGVLGRTQPLTPQFLTGDQNIVHLRVVVQYSVAVPTEYLFQSQDVTQLVKGVAESEFAQRVAMRGVDALLTTDKVAVQDEVRASAQRILNEYRVGVQLASVSIESAGPPPEAADAFRDVASARADAARIINEAQGYANDLLPKARGEAEQMREASLGYRQRKINEAQGDAARFNQVAGEYARASEVNGHRLYVETMEQILPRIRKVFVDRNGNLDLTLIRKGETQAPPKP